MNKYDIYLYDDCNVLKNKFGVKDEKKLDLIESNIASTNMSTLYSSGFSDFHQRECVMYTKPYSVMFTNGQDSTEI